MCFCESYHLLPRKTQSIVKYCWANSLTWWNAGMEDLIKYKICERYSNTSSALINVYRRASLSLVWVIIRAWQLVWIVGGWNSMCGHRATHLTHWTIHVPDKYIWRHIQPNPLGGRIVVYTTKHNFEVFVI